VQRLYATPLAHWAKKQSWKETAESFHTRWDKVVQSVQYVVKWGLEHRELGEYAPSVLTKYSAGKATST